MFVGRLRWLSHIKSVSPWFRAMVRGGVGLFWSAVQRRCAEAGGRVSTNVMMRDLDILGPHAAMDGRRLEVLAATSVRGGAVLQP